jgi:tyrosyl-tRNA synthetase
MRAPQTPGDFLPALKKREMFHQATEGAEQALQQSTGIYAGFDPTAPSLHVGNLIPIMGLVRAQQAGHKPVALVGGGTGMIGDPGGRSAERPLLDLPQIDANVLGIRRQLESFLDFTGPVAAKLVNNAEWLRELKLVDFLRDTGKHFSVNYMLAKDSVASRLEGGISFTEFSYMLLQGYDFAELHKRHGVTVQFGGSDQWGNILAGTELLRRAHGVDSHAVTFPLLTTASGKKFGKSEGGAVWLDAAQTSPYEFFQFWVNADDADTLKLLRWFTLVPDDRLAELAQEIANNPAGRVAQRELARDVTARVHGATALAAAEQVTGFFFGGVEPSALTDDALAILAREAPFAAVTGADIGEMGADGAPATSGRLDVYRMLTATGLAASNGAAKKLLEQGAVSINKKKLAAGDRYVEREGTTLRGGHIVLGKGKRDFALLRLS